ncbi:MAG: GNAT family N-acetyltransferase [Deltaproteobacteria bacterium]
MLLLDIREYKRAIPMVQAADINTLFALSVLEGRVRGRVFTDQQAEPASFYIQHPYGMALLCGESTNEGFYAKLTTHLLNLDDARDQAEWLQVYPASLYSRIEAILGPNLIKKKPNEQYDVSQDEDRRVLEYQRINFVFNQEKYLSFKSSLPRDDHKIVATSEVMFDEINGSVVPRHFWNNAGDFIRNGIGFTVLKNDVPISTAYSSFIIGDRLEIGIETSVDHRGAGLASVVCAELIDYCLTKGYKPVWACGSGNMGSRKLAHRLGFEEAKRIPYYRLPQ